MHDTVSIGCDLYHGHFLQIAVAIARFKPDFFELVLKVLQSPLLAFGKRFATLKFVRRKNADMLLHTIH